MRIILLAAVASLAACATPTVYQPAAGPDEAGYSAMRIEDDRYRISFRGGDDATDQQVRDYALRRAAELTLEEGHDWFLVTDRTADAAPPSGPRFSLGLGGANYGGSTGVGGGLGVSFGGGGGARSGAMTATLEIVMGDGDAPEDVNAYDALAVARSLAGR